MYIETAKIIKKTSTIHVVTSLRCPSVIFGGDDGRGTTHREALQVKRCVVNPGKAFSRTGGMSFIQHQGSQL